MSPGTAPLVPLRGADATALAAQLAALGIHLRAAEVLTLCTALGRDPTRAELALMLEPTGNAAELGCLGTLHARVTFHGRAAHSARPWLGENAIHKAGPFLTRLASTPPREHAEGAALFREVLSATLAEGGSARNVVPDRFTVNLNFRFAPDRSPEDAAAHVRSLAPAGTTVEIVDLAPAAPARADAPLFGVVSRLTWQKGMDIFAATLDAMVATGARLALIGTGEKASDTSWL